MENVKTDSDRSLFFLWAVCHHDDRGDENGNNENWKHHVDLA